MKTKKKEDDDDEENLLSNGLFLFTRQRFRWTANKVQEPPKSQVNNLSILLYWTVAAVDTETIHFLHC